MRSASASGKLATAFNPSIGSATLRSYYDADTGVTNVSGKASVWTDQGPAADTFTNGVAANRLTILSNWRNGHTALYSAPTTDAGFAIAVDTIAQPYTIYMVVEWAAPGATGQQRPLLMANSNSVQIGQVATPTSGLGQTQYIQQPYMYAGGTSLTYTAGGPSPGTPCIIRAVFNGTSSTLRITVNGGQTLTASGGSPGSASYGGVASIGVIGSNNWFGKIATIAVYSGTPSTDDDSYIMGALGSKYAIRPAPYRVPVVSCVGNSLTFGSGLTDGGNVPSFLQRALGNAARCDNWGHSAYATPALTALLATEGMTSLTATPCVMYLWEGGNDLLGVTPAQAWADYVTFLSAARSLGWYQPIIINTIGYRGDLANWKIDEFNALMVANWESAGFDACITNFGTNPALQFPGQTDQVHYTYQQNVVIAQMWADAIQALLGLPPSL